MPKSASQKSTRQKAVGSRLQVWNGTAKRTAGNLFKKDLKMNPKTGKIVSKEQSKIGKQRWKDTLKPWLKEHGFKA